MALLSIVTLKAELQLFPHQQLDDLGKYILEAINASK